MNITFLHLNDVNAIKKRVTRGIRSKVMKDNYQLISIRCELDLAEQKCNTSEYLQPS